ncbi:hypothetical protein CGZ80_11970 [Rhodopirellula sp. MGV]|nr:hypothetical protein CGZ80_11970 [Rhodopirellula sp. MGV]PNY37731.1 hypothetical protein C2E31_06245 [Rhodopirellula baltica]
MSPGTFYFPGTFSFSASAPGTARSPWSHWIVFDRLTEWSTNTWAEGEASYLAQPTGLGLHQNPGQLRAKGPIRYQLIERSTNIRAEGPTGYLAQPTGLGLHRNPEHLRAKGPVRYQFLQATRNNNAQCRLSLRERSVPQPKQPHLPNQIACSNPPDDYNE